MKGERWVRYRESLAEAICCSDLRHRHCERSNPSVERAATMD
jgi:hypothetical protein